MIIYLLPRGLLWGHRSRRWPQLLLLPQVDTGSSPLLDHQAWVGRIVRRSTDHLESPRYRGTRAGLRCTPAGDSPRT